MIKIGLSFTINIVLLKTSDKLLISTSHLGYKENTFLQRALIGILDIHSQAFTLITLNRFILAS